MVKASYPCLRDKAQTRNSNLETRNCSASPPPPHAFSPVLTRLRACFSTPDRLVTSPPSHRLNHGPGSETVARKFAPATQRPPEPPPWRARPNVQEQANLHGGVPDASSFLARSRSCWARSSCLSFL